MNMHIDRDPPTKYHDINTLCGVQTDMNNTLHIDADGFKSTVLREDMCSACLLIHFSDMGKE